MDTENNTENNKPEATTPNEVTKIEEIISPRIPPLVWYIVLSIFTFLAYNNFLNRLVYLIILLCYGLLNLVFNITTFSNKYINHQIKLDDLNWIYYLSISEKKYEPDVEGSFDIEQCRRELYEETTKNRTDEPDQGKRFDNAKIQYISEALTGLSDAERDCIKHNIHCPTKYVFVMDISIYSNPNNIFAKNALFVINVLGITSKNFTTENEKIEKNILDKAKENYESKIMNTRRHINQEFQNSMKIN